MCSLTLKCAGPTCCCFALLGKRCRFLSAGLGSTSSPTFIHSWAHASVGNNVDFETKVHKTFSQEEGKALQCRILYKL